MSTKRVVIISNEFGFEPIILRAEKVIIRHPPKWKPERFQLFGKKLYEVHDKELHKILLEYMVHTRNRLSPRLENILQEYGHWDAYTRNLEQIKTLKVTTPIGFVNIANAIEYREQQKEALAQRLRAVRPYLHQEFQLNLSVLQKELWPNVSEK